MIKNIRVILGLESGQFAAGLSRSRAALGGFLSGVKSGIGGAVSFFGDLGNAVRLAEQVIGGLIGTAKSLFDTFIGGVAAEQRLTAQLGVLMGGLDNAKTFLSGVAEENMRVGFTTDDMIPVINQGATALKAMTGAVDPAQLEKFVKLVRQIKSARPDLEFQQIGLAVSKFISGDVESFKRILGVGVEDIQGLSEDAQKTLGAMQQTQSMQLGAVTKIAGEQVKPTAEQSLALLDEVTDKLGMGQEAVETYSTSWEASVNRLKEMWDTFADAVGAPLLDALMEELQKLGEWLIAHKEDIEKLGKKLGELGAKGLENAMEALMRVDWDKVSQDAVAMVDAFSKIDWGAIAKVIGQVADYLGTSPEKVAEDEAKNANGPLVGKETGAGVGGIAAGIIAGNAGATGNAKGQVDVHVSVSVDDDGKLSAHVKNEAGRAANQAVGDLVTSTVGKKIKTN